MGVQVIIVQFMLVRRRAWRQRYNYTCTFNTYFGYRAQVAIFRMSWDDHLHSVTTTDCAAVFNFRVHTLQVS